MPSCIYGTCDLQSESILGSDASQERSSRVLFDMHAILENASSDLGAASTHLVFASGSDSLSGGSVHRSRATTCHTLFDLRATVTMALPCHSRLCPRHSRILPIHSRIFPRRCDSRAGSDAMQKLHKQHSVYQRISGVYLAYIWRISNHRIATC